MLIQPTAPKWKQAVTSRTVELMRLGKRMLELDAAVTVASLRPA